jgi:hypothetical protein
MADFSDFNNDDLMGHIDEGYEYLGEMEAEIGSEVARFGDGPPGSALQVASIRESLAAALAEGSRRGLEVHPLPFPCREIASILRYVEFNPEPFPGEAERMVALELVAISEAPPEDDIPF